MHPWRKLKVLLILLLFRPSWKLRLLQRDSLFKDRSSPPARPSKWKHPDFQLFAPSVQISHYINVSVSFSASIRDAPIPMYEINLTPESLRMWQDVADPPSGTITWGGDLAARQYESTHQAATRWKWVLLLRGRRKWHRPRRRAFSFGGAACTDEARPSFGTGRPEAWTKRFNV